jgi:hypothetical protein
MIRNWKMENRRLKLAVVSLALLSLLSSRSVLADQSDRTHQIGSKIKCMCNGCDQAAGKCYHVEPPKTGFGLVAWLMPILYLLGGLALVVVVMKRWRKRPVAVAAVAGANGIHVSPELLARAREQAQRETEE